MTSVPIRLGREVHDLSRGRTATHLHLRERLITIALVTLLMDLVGSLLVYLFEHDARGSEVTTFGDSLFWTTAQLLTVSSQLKNPISTGGRIVDVVLELYAITVVATLAGSFGAFFHRRGLERDPIGE
jgi:hypothetical protein